MNLYIGNLNYRLEENELQEAFEAYGTVASVKIITDRETGRSRGFAFVEMPNDEEARKAIDALHESELNGRTIYVNQAREQKR